MNEPGTTPSQPMSVQALRELHGTIIERVKTLSSDTVEKPVLIYFDIIGICWPIRCLLHLRGVDYELVQIPFAIWGADNAPGSLKSQFRNGHLPLYVDQAVDLNQSQLIIDYLADRYELAGRQPSERMRVREVTAHCNDALFHWNGLFTVNVKGGLREDAVEARLRAFMGEGSWGLSTNGWDNNLRVFERFLAHGGEFIVGSHLSVADLVAFSVLCHWYKAFDRERFGNDYPRLDAYIGHIAGQPGIGNYMREQQEATTWFRLPAALRLTTPEELEGLF